MKFNIGDKVKIVHYAKEFNGLRGVVNRIDGEYHYVTCYINNTKVE